MPSPRLCCRLRPWRSGSALRQQAFDRAAGIARASNRVVDRPVGERASQADGFNVVRALTNTRHRTNPLGADRDELFDAPARRLTDACPDESSRSSPERPSARGATADDPHPRRSLSAHYEETIVITPAPPRLTACPGGRELNRVRRQTGPRPPLDAAFLYRADASPSHAACGNRDLLCLTISPEQSPLLVRRSLAASPRCSMSSTLSRAPTIAQSVLGATSTRFADG